MNRVWIWVVPDPDAFVSGGNRYNASLMAALKQRGEQVTRISMNEVLAHANVGPNTFWMWDSMYLEYFEKVAHELPGKSGLILHYLPIERRPFFPRTASKADLIIIPGECYRTLLSSLGMEEEQIFTLSPGLESIPILKPRVRSGPLKWITVANLVPEKGLVDFLESNTWKTSPHLVPYLDIYGDDRLNPSYSTAIIDLLRTPTWENKIHYKGRLPSFELWSRFDAYDAFLSTSPHESYGMAVRESLQAGLPVFGLTGGHLPQLVDHPRKGKLFDQLDSLGVFLANTIPDEFRQYWAVPLKEELRPQGPDWILQATLLQEKANALFTKGSGRRPG